MDAPNKGHDPHPRRPPTHRSVSLRHTPPQERSNVHQLDRAGPTPPSLTGPRSDRANPPSSVSPTLRTHKESSRESSDAGKWFEKSNNHVAQNTSFVDNEPPFFLHNSSSSETPPELQGQQITDRNMHSTAMAFRPGIAHPRANGSGSDDYRSVIDDLTIANKRLKQKLRKHKRLYDAPSQDDKLFEVRFHGLSGEKRKELEETLRKFAQGLSDSPSNDLVPSAFLPPALRKNPTSSLTSTRFAESGYASMSISGQNSVSLPPGSILANKTARSPLNRHHHNVQSYLHDIPPSLIGNPDAMTEKAKKKLVVRRLEQIFAGKLPASGDHSEPIQQQQASQSAARADREARQAIGQSTGKEGIREARIMPQDDDPRTTEDASPDAPHYIYFTKPVSEHDSSSSRSPDQRPTRPLDLDPYRAKDPLENMDYIRHLGFTPPDMDFRDAPQHDHGWIYLNLLINMAQLHTFNVTPDFVKTAVADYSSKYEISHDGRKLRWKGGHEVTRNSSDSSSEQQSSASPDESEEMQKRERKKSKAGHFNGEATVDPAQHARKLARQEKEREKNKFAYTPLFFHQPDSDGDDDFDVDDESSGYFPMPAHLAAHSSGDSLLMRKPSLKRRNPGPVIFYNNANFCTDLSADRCGVAETNAKSYKTMTSRPIGINAAIPTTPSYEPDFDDIKGPLANLSLQPDDQMDLDHSTSSESGIRFASEASELDDSPRASPARINFEASGLGGVQPVDNFAIDVQLRKRRVEYPHGLVTVRRVVSKPRQYPHRILEVLKRDAKSSSHQSGAIAQSLISEEIISTSHQELPNSTLPPPSMLPFDSSSGDGDSDAESDVSSAPSARSSHVNLRPLIAPRLLNISPPHDDGGDDWDEEDDAESDSVDLLATARAIDPTLIHAQEREYDFNTAERLAEDIPAGSSAATGAGGSGFNTPRSMIVTVATDGAQQHSTAGTRGQLLSNNLKRARTSDSIAALNPGKAPKLD